MLRDLYTEAGWAGIAAGRSQLRTAAARKMVTKSSIDWEGWEPGDAEAAAKLIGTSKAPGLKNLLDGANVTIKGIEETRYNDLAGVLARSVADGLGVDETAKQIDAMFDKGADWADMVARTETARAVTAGTLDSYADAGVTKVEWLTADGGCPICGEFESMGPVEMDQGFGDVEGPPAHPNCLCTLLPVLPEGVVVEEPEVIAPEDEIAAGEIVIEEPTAEPLVPNRPDMGDGIRVDDKEFTDLMRTSGSRHIIGRTDDGIPIFTPERQALHDSIIRDAVDNIPRSDDPTFHMLGGGPAAGKSTMEKTVVGEYEGKMVGVNADNIKAKLPEYQKMLDENDPNAAAFTHEESSYIAKRMQAAAFERQQDIVLDGTGDSSIESLTRKISKARANGYTVKGYYATCPTDEAVRRATVRAKEIGREVPEAIIRNTHSSVSRVFPAAIDGFDELKLFDTTVKDTARLIGEGGRGTFKIIDRAEYEAFLNKGREPYYSDPQKFAERMRDARTTGRTVGATNIDSPDVMKKYLMDNGDALGLTPDEAVIYGEAYELRLSDLRMLDLDFAAASPEAREKIAEYVDKVRQDGTVMIASKPEAAVKILSDGRVKSQFEVNRSNGAYDKYGRAKWESRGLDVHPGLQPDQRPVYGYVGTVSKTPAGPKQYGDIRFELKPDVKDRTSMTVGDSLSTRAKPIPMTGQETTQQQAFRAVTKWQMDSASQGTGTLAELEQRTYNEAQIMGGVSSDDIAAMWVPSYSAEYADAISAAQKMNIPVKTYKMGY